MINKYIYIYTEYKLCTYIYTDIYIIIYKWISNIVYPVRKDTHKAFANLRRGRGEGMGWGRMNPVWVTSILDIRCSTSIHTCFDRYRVPKMRLDSLTSDVSDPPAPCGKIRIAKQASTNKLSARAVLTRYNLIGKHIK